MAILLAAEVRLALGREIDRLRPGARGVGWVVPDNLHLTLKFLGGVEQERLERVAGVVAAAARAGAAFDVTVRGLGAFPSPTRPRVIWAGVARGAAEMAALATGLEDALAGLGFPPEGRPFSPHITLGRVREPRRDPALAAALGAAADRDYGGFRVDRVALMRSDLSPRGARYTMLESWALGG